jgi:hypothetical protein
MKREKVYGNIEREEREREHALWEHRREGEKKGDVQARKKGNLNLQTHNRRNCGCWILCGRIGNHTLSIKIFH